MREVQLYHSNISDVEKTRGRFFLELLCVGGTQPGWLQLKIIFKSKEAEDTFSRFFQIVGVSNALILLHRDGLATVANALIQSPSFDRNAVLIKGDSLRTRIRVGSQLLRPDE